NIYWVERVSATVRKCDVNSGIVQTIAGTGVPGFSGDGGPATKAQLNEPHSIGFAGSGNLYICDVKNHRVRQVEMKTGIISALVSFDEQLNLIEGGAQDIRAVTAGVSFRGPRAVDFDRNGNLWLALREGNAILKFNSGSGLHKGYIVAGNGKK